MITLPIALLIVALSSPISSVVYGASYSYVSLYLSLYLLAYVFEGLGGITLSNLILGLGETRVMLYTSIITIVAGAPLAWVLVARYQVVGLLITMIVAPRFGWLYQVVWARKKVNITIDVKGITLVYLSGIAAFLFTYAMVYFVHFGSWVMLILGGLVFAAIYVMSLLFTGSIKKRDLEQIAAATDSFGIFSKIIRMVIPILAKFVRG
jgi:O-antigen/teichoic acid export membrane protein